MKTLLGIYLIFSITISAGTCLQCQKCENYLGDSCLVSTTETCAPSVKNCFTSLSVGKFGGVTYPVVIKLCGIKEQSCHSSYNMSAGVEYYFTAKCCEGDMCNKDSIKLPPTDSTENGLQCPVCYANAKNCTPTGTIKCQGPQTKCFTFSGAVYDNGKFVDCAFQGCATESLCLNGSPMYPESTLQEGYTLTCSDK